MFSHASTFSNGRASHARLPASTTYDRWTRQTGVVSAREVVRAPQTVLMRFLQIPHARAQLLRDARREQRAMTLIRISLEAEQRDAMTARFVDDRSHRIMRLRDMRLVLREQLVARNFVFQAPIRIARCP